MQIDLTFWGVVGLISFVAGFAVMGGIVFLAVFSDAAIRKIKKLKGR